MKQKNEIIWSLLFLHLLFLVYSFAGVLAKTTSYFSFLSISFLLCYTGQLLMLVIYAFFWQQLIKKLPLSVAYSNKAIDIFWGLIWGVIIFHESISFKQVVGVILVIFGVIIYALSIKDPNKMEDEKTWTKIS